MVSYCYRLEDLLLTGNDETAHDLCPQCKFVDGSFTHHHSLTPSHHQTFHQTTFTSYGLIYVVPQVSIGSGDLATAAWAKETTSSVPRAPPKKCTCAWDADGPRQRPTAVLHCSSSTLLLAPIKQTSIPLSTEEARSTDGLTPFFRVTPPAAVYYWRL